MFFDESSPSLSTGVLLRDISSPRVSLLDAHINRRWRHLSSQSRRRLGVLAASTGLGTSVSAHAQLIGAFSLIAEAEGVYESERLFAEDYLGVPWICEAVAESERARDKRERNRLAVAKYRDKHKRSTEAQRERSAEDRLDAVRSQRAIAVDGEGVTLPDGSHIYRYLAACCSDGRLLGELDREDGITSREAVEFLTSLPKYDEDGQEYLGVFGYGLGYDMTKWLEQLKNKSLYELFHSEDLKPKAKCGSVNLLLIGRCLELVDRRAPKGERRTKVWDILKGFQSTFVKALRDWEVGTEAEWARIEAMKKQRGNFADEPWERVTAYCRSECKLLAELAETYIRAHVDAGIDLRGKYHGAGSTGDAFLDKMGALEKRCTRDIDSLELDAYGQTKSAFSRAFFGGRSEVSRIGVVKGPVWTADIASAYPHVLYSLPCVVHGQWKKVQGRGLGRALGAAKLACVHFRIPSTDAHRRDEPLSSRRIGSDDRPVVKRGRRKDSSEEVNELQRTVHERMLSVAEGFEADVGMLAWGPLPYRTVRGSIVFPMTHPGGWAWKAEYEAAVRLHAGVEAVEAWVLGGQRCKCGRPYAVIGDYYLLRLSWGKEARGKVLKLGLNSCYGKFAQVIGKNPKYSCRAVAGHITSTTRARLYEGMLSAGDPWNVVYAATDGLIATEPLAPPNPPSNETTAHTKKWLGVWEVERHDEELFIVQPGFYFSLAPTGRAKTRGTPLDVIYAYRAQILDQWREAPTRKPRGLPLQSTFHGVKSSIRPPTKDSARYRRDPLYGRWTETERKIAYVVSPKRAALDTDDGGESYRLETWWMRPGNPESAEYKKDAAFLEAEAIRDDQPDFVESLGGGVGEREGE